MRARRLSLLLLFALGCTGADHTVATDTTGLSTGTGLEGVVRRGPIRPVCVPDEACVAPFSARFEVRSGERLVTRFRSDSSGRFAVPLAPGEYTVAPDSSAGLLGVMWQTRTVVIGSTGPTHIELEFDTGIR
jgi:hypothetical protein